MMVRFAILGAGNIAHRFAASLSHEPRAKLVAASCRSKEKAEAFLCEVSCDEGARAYGSHDELLRDSEVDAVYLALPHALHREWAVRALRAGKDVLCEKPAMLTAGEMEEVAAVARETGHLFMEAMKPRFVPLYQQVLDVVAELGAVKRVEATLCNDMLGMVEGTGTYHMEPGPGAGVLLDCGIYCASWVAAFCLGDLELLSFAGEQKNGVDICGCGAFQRKRSGATRVRVRSCEAAHCDACVRARSCCGGRAASTDACNGVPDRRRALEH